MIITKDNIFLRHIEKNVFLRLCKVLLANNKCVRKCVSFCFRKSMKFRFENYKDMWTVLTYKCA